MIPQCLSTRWEEKKESAEEELPGNRTHVINRKIREGGLGVCSQ